MRRWWFFDMAALRERQEATPLATLEIGTLDYEECPTVDIEARDPEQAHRIAKIRGLCRDDAGCLPRRTV